ncbi:UBC-like protein [Meredithblackwellia eburnea MCA 4105]
MSRIGSKRLTKELTDLHNGGVPAGCKLLKADDLETWEISLTIEDSVYSDEVFVLRFRFGKGYPIEPPEVTFVITDGYKAPIHPHIYSNGHICASILNTSSGGGWSPVLTVASVCLTMQSMLASCKQKELPPDNDRYVRNAPKSPKDTRWAFHDDDC